MQIITTHKSTDFDVAASVLATKILYPEAVAVLPKSLNPNVRDFLSIHKDLFDVHTPDKIELEEVWMATDLWHYIKTGFWESKKSGGFKCTGQGVYDHECNYNKTRNESDAGGPFDDKA